MNKNLPDSRWGTRHVQCFMASLGLVVLFGLRANLSVAIVPMTRKSSSSAGFPVLPWDASTKGTILSSFFWGYILLQIPAGQMAEKYGPKFLLVAVAFFSGALTCLTPYAAIHGGAFWMIFTRALEGLAQGFCLPCMNVLVSKWVPTPEKGRLFTWVISGSPFGTFLTMAVGGILADSRWGWPSVFYVSGGSAILWALVYSYVGSNSPEDHQTISETEKKYILSSLAGGLSQRKDLKTPWTAIATSGPFWALCLAHTSAQWGYYTLLTQIPSYLNAVFGLNIHKSGILSALPYLSNVIFGLICAPIGDWLINREVLSKIASKRLWNSVGMWGPALALCILAFAGNNTFLAQSQLMIAMALLVCLNFGFFSNHLDLAPNFAGTLMGIGNSICGVSGLLSPLFVGFVVTDPTSLFQWQIVFLTAAGIFFVGNIIFILFGSVEVQPWNYSPEEQRQESEAPPVGKPV